MLKLERIDIASVISLPPDITELVQDMQAETVIRTEDNPLLREALTVTTLALKGLVYAHRFGEYRYPADWWQHFKLRWFPWSWKLRWPVRYKEFDVYSWIPKIRYRKEGYESVIFIKEKL